MATVGIRAKADKALKNWVKNSDQHFRNVIRAAVDSIGNAAATRAQANAPIDTGDLRAHIRAGKVREVGDSAEIFVEADMPYALKMHEQLTPYGRFQLGPLSRVQPMTREGGVGGKYLSRAIEQNIKLWERVLGDTVKQNMGGAVKSTQVTVGPIRQPLP